MKRREILITAVPLVSLSSGCNILGKREPTLWSIDVTQVQVNQIDFDVNINNSEATSKRPAEIELTFENPTSDVWTVRHAECPERSTNHSYFENMILFPASLSDDFTPEPIEPECWKPDPNSFFWACEAVVVTTEISPGESMSIRHSVWMAEESECIPNDTYSFEVRGAADEKDMFPVIGTFSIRTEPA